MQKTHGNAGKARPDLMLGSEPLTETRTFRMSKAELNTLQKASGKRGLSRFVIESALSVAENLSLNLEDSKIYRYRQNVYAVVLSNGSVFSAHERKEMAERMLHSYNNIREKKLAKGIVEPLAESVVFKEFLFLKEDSAFAEYSYY